MLRPTLLFTTLRQLWPRTTVSLNSAPDMSNPICPRASAQPRRVAHSNLLRFQNASILRASHRRLACDILLSMKRQGQLPVFNNPGSALHVCLFIKVHHILGSGTQVPTQSR
ncbi:hypothetical protein MVEN_00044000 [Mycena venus]|uniref:Uncharacterized protein n=1 Tax=Mycena venus TaxID=2733690 RepID=A0A8H6Z3E2_9AGAR|nr:hypothetical protein MVEN_00044000 [Mycena venus]